MESSDEVKKRVETQLLTFSVRAYLFQQKVLDALNLSPSDFHCIHVLDTEGPTTAGKIAEKIGLSTSATTSVINRLINHDLVVRVDDKADRRKVIVSLHTANIEKMRGFYQPITQHVRQVLDGMEPKDLTLVSQFFDAIQNVDPQAWSRDNPTPSSTDS